MIPQVAWPMLGQGHGCPSGTMDRAWRPWLSAKVLRLGQPLAILWPSIGNECRRRCA